MFDILPLYGVLRPHSSHQISFTFYGHCDIMAQAKALCEVEGGPTYEIMLRGEASLVNYSFDTKDINYGLQVLPTAGRGVPSLTINIAPSSVFQPLLEPWVITVSPPPLTLISNPDHPTANCWPGGSLVSLSPEIQHVRRLPSQSRSPYRPLPFFHYHLISPLSLQPPRHLPPHSLSPPHPYQHPGMLIHQAGSLYIGLPFPWPPRFSRHRGFSNHA